MSSMPAFRRRRRLRDKTMLGATIIAYLRESEVDSMACDQLAAELGVGAGRTISACDELARVGYLVKDRGVVALTGMAREAVDGQEDPAAA
jgi:hypothetical protein